MVTTICCMSGEYCAARVGRREVRRCCAANSNGCSLGTMECVCHWPCTWCGQWKTYFIEAMPFTASAVPTLFCCQPSSEWSVLYGHTIQSSVKMMTVGSQGAGAGRKWPLAIVSALPKTHAVQQTGTLVDFPL